MKDFKTVVLRDYQSLDECAQGISGTIGTTTEYNHKDFWYKVTEIDNSNSVQPMLIIEKHVGSSCDMYVCYRDDQKFGDRCNFEYLFENDRYVDTIESNGKQFSLILSHYGSSNGKPCISSEYECCEEDNNPRVFFFESINDNAPFRSYIEVYRGTLVKESEIDIC